MVVSCIQSSSRIVPILRKLDICRWLIDEGSWKKREESVSLGDFIEFLFVLFKLRKVILEGKRNHHFIIIFFFFNIMLIKFSEVLEDRKKELVLKTFNIPYILHLVTDVIFFSRVICVKEGG